MIADAFSPAASVVVYPGDALDFLRSLPSESIQLIVTSPPYNMGRPYERRLSLDEYLQQHVPVITECWRVLAPMGSICWQVGTYVRDRQVLPLDILFHPVFARLGFRYRNRIVWHFRGGLHTLYRFSGRYETVNWYTKSDDYVFNLDAVRVPSLNANKKVYKGPRKGQLWCNPLGKNPGDVWIITNIHHGQPEKTGHPAQYPEALVERLVLALSNKDDWVLDPYLGSGTSIVVAARHGRRGAGSEIKPEYVEMARQRIKRTLQGLREDT